MDGVDEVGEVEEDNRNEISMIEKYISAVMFFIQGDYTLLYKLFSQVFALI